MNINTSFTLINTLLNIVIDTRLADCVCNII